MGAPGSIQPLFQCNPRECWPALPPLRRLTFARQIRGPLLSGDERCLLTAGRSFGAEVAPLTDGVWAMVDAADAGLIGTRDRELILLGFAGTFRRSELVALDVEDSVGGVKTPDQSRQKIDEAN